MSDYDVHICYNGLEIENNFISHLKQAFHDRRISTTNDDNWHIRGEDVSQTTLEAIEKARSSVIVFCEHFAAKRRCLDELVKVLECEKKGQLVRVIYFQIDPSVVQNLGGSYGTAMASYRESFKNDSIKVDRWEVSLYNAACLDGRPYKNGNQSQFIQQFVEGLSRKLNLPSSCGADCLAGPNSHIPEPPVIRGRGAWNLPKAPWPESFFTVSRMKEPENGETDQPSTSNGCTPKFGDIDELLGAEGTDLMQDNVLLDSLRSEGNATRKRKLISDGAKFSAEADDPQKQISTRIKDFPRLNSSGIEDDLISRKPKGSEEAFSASARVVNSTLVAVKGTVAMTTSEEVKSAMQTVQTYTSKRFHELIGEGPKFKEHIEKNVLRFRADGKISRGMFDVLNGLLRCFTCWSQQYDVANNDLEATAAYLSKADELQADFAAVVYNCGKAESAEGEVEFKLLHKLLEKRELQKKLKAIESEIADLRSSHQNFAGLKSSLLDKGTKLKEERDDLIVQLPRIEGERAAAKTTQQSIEAEWSKIVEVFNVIFESEFGSS